MLRHFCEWLSGFALSTLALSAVLFAVYRLRLQFHEIRRRRQKAEKGLRFGLIQEVSASKRPLAAAAPIKIAVVEVDPADVSSRDSGAKILTIFVPQAPFDPQWN